MLHHTDVWRAIDRLAQRHGFSPSGLARKAGLSATIFNPSKRIHRGRRRWPSTESIAAILKATGSSLDDFVALASDDAQQHNKLPLIDLADASGPDVFDEQGLPSGKKWDAVSLPGANDSGAFVIEVSSRAFDPIFREGSRLLLSPTEKPRRGDRVALRTTQGEIMVKSLGREGAQKIELLSLTAEDQPLTLTRQEVDWIYRIVWASQ